jgi:hypothetical protein
MLYEQALTRRGEDRQRDVLLAVAVVADPRRRRGLARGRQRHHQLGELRVLLDELSSVGCPESFSSVLTSEAIALIGNILAVFASSSR